MPTKARATKSGRPQRRPARVSVNKSSGRRRPSAPAVVAATQWHQLIIHETVSVLIVISVALLGFVAMFSTSSATDHIEDLVTSEPSKWYVASAAGYRLRLPLDWTTTEYAVEQDSVKYQAVVASQGSEKLVIYTNPAELASNIPASATDIRVGGLAAKQFSDDTWKLNQGTQHLVINRQDGFVNEIVGSGTAYLQAVSSYKYLSIPNF